MNGNSPDTGTPHPRGGFTTPPLEPGKQRPRLSRKNLLLGGTAAVLLFGAVQSCGGAAEPAQGSAPTPQPTVFVTETVEVTPTVTVTTTMTTTPTPAKVTSRAPVPLAAPAPKKAVAATPQTAAPKPRVTSTATSKATSSYAYYPNCSAVRAAGADPLYAGSPGYSRKLDRDGDGVACE